MAQIVNGIVYTKKLAFFWKLLCVVVSFLSCETLFAQPKCSISHFSTEDGLSDNHITTIFKDSEGFMWFGTWAGLNRYDGHSFMVFKTHPGDRSVLKNNRIDQIYGDESSFLWLRTNDQQFYRFDKRTGQFLAATEIIQEDKKEIIAFKDAVITKEGAIWLISKKHGVFYITNANTPKPSYKRYATPDVTFFHEDFARKVWIGTSKGLKLLVKEKGNYKYAGVDARLKSLSMSAVAEDNTCIWLASDQGDLFSCNKFSGAVTNKKVSNHKINYLLASKKVNTLYCSTQGGEIINIERNNWQSSTAVIPGKTPLFTLYEDIAGRLWINPDGYGIIRFDSVRQKFSYYTQRTDIDYAQNFRGFKVFEDRKGRFWAIMKGGGFGYYDEEADKMSYFYNDPNSSTKEFANSVTTMFYDPDGVLWLSTYDRGLHKVIFHELNFDVKMLEPNASGRTANDVRSIYNDIKNRLWVGTKDGTLHIYKNGQKLNNVLTNVPAMGLGMIYTILEDRHHNIWLGTKGNGLFKAVPLDVSRNRYKLIHYTKEKEGGALKSKLIYALAEDNKGRIWVGTYGEGLTLILNEGTESRFVHIGDSFPKYPPNLYNKIRHLSLDVSGNLWIATTNGLLVANPNEDSLTNTDFSLYRKISGDITSLGDNDVQYIYSDSRDNMWIATSNGGLNKAIGKDLKKLIFKNFSVSDGLPSDYIMSLTEDKLGNLWLGTQNGLSLFDKVKTFRNYGSFDGLPNTTFSEAACVKLPDGELVFGTVGGILTFQPSQLKGYKIEGKIAFTNLQINNEDVFPGKEKFAINNVDNLELNYNQDILSIDYSILDYRTTDNRTYQIRLKGFDNVWRNNKDRIRATYTNLPPGDYLFEVKSNNTDLYKNKPYKKIRIVILPPLWRTWWAYLIYIIIGGILIFVIRRTIFTVLKLKQGIEIERRLTELKLRFFTNISHELRTPLTLIQNPVEQLLKKEDLSERGIVYAQIVQRNVERMERFISQLLDFRKVQSGNAHLNITQIALSPFIDHIIAFFTDALEEKNSTIKVTGEKEYLFIWCDADKIETVFYNVLANAIKFGPYGGTIYIDIVVLEKQSVCRISVRDEGDGVAEYELNDIFNLYYEGVQPGTRHIKGTGIGLSIAKEFINLHGGNIYAQNSENNKGLIIFIELNMVFERYESVLDVKTDSIPEGPQVLNQSDESQFPVLLLVEDNADMRLFIVEQLKEFFQVFTAENGQEGMEKALNMLPALIISDVMMPVMDGIELLDKLKKTTETSHIPVVLLTAKSSVENRIEGIKYGADYYLTKPFSNDLLLAVINNLLEHRKRLFQLLFESQKPTELVSDKPAVTAQDELFLQNVIQFVEAGMHDPAFNIESMADISNMSRSAFYRKFRSLTEVAPVELVREMRLKKARCLFDSGEQVVAEVAYQVGFENPNYFGVCFKQYSGRTPSAYIRDRRT